MATAILVLVALFGSASVVAQNSLPGHLLYPMKVGVNEEVLAALNVSDKAKAAWDAHRAEERLEEAEEVSAKEEVSADIRADLESRFKLFADRADARIKALADVDARAAADIASNFEVALNAHAKVLASLTANTNDHLQAELTSLRGKAATEAQEAANIRASAEAKVRAKGNGPEVKTAAEGKLGAAENVIAAARRFVTAKSDVMTADEKARANAQLSLADSLLVQGRAKLDAGAYAEAFNLGNAAIRAAQSVHVVLDVTERLEDDIVPDQDEHPTPSLPASASDRARTQVELRLNF